MVERPDDARADAVQDFAARLRSLRESAGRPSFRELSARSKAISHTTLHEAAQGNRLASWSTVVEFVKACGGDPDRFRAAWDHADAVVRGVAPVPSGEQLEPEKRAEPVPLVPTPAAGPVGSARDPGPGRRRRTPWVLAGAAVVVVAGVVTAVAVATAGSGSTTGSAGPTGPNASDVALTGCPVAQTEPPSVPPVTAGDAAVFVADVTLPDCTRVAPGTTVVKTWRFKNVGTVRWTGYSLHRIDLPETRDQCQTITDIRVPDTAPGAFAEVSTEITTPPRAGFCIARFKFEDAAGRIAFPGNRPVNFQLVVGAV